MEIKVRFAEREELESVNKIRRQVHKLHSDGRPDIFRSEFDNELQSRIYERFDSENCRIIAALCEEKICGFAVIKYIIKPPTVYAFERKYCETEELGVDENFRRMGVAAKIFDFIKADAAEKGFDRIELNMWEFNENALKFYESIGFKIYRRYMEMSVKE